MVGAGGACNPGRAAGNRNAGSGELGGAGDRRRHDVVTRMGM